MPVGPRWALGGLPDKPAAAAGKVGQLVRRAGSTACGAVGFVPFLPGICLRSLIFKITLFWAPSQAPWSTYQAGSRSAGLGWAGCRRDELGWLLGPAEAGGPSQTQRLAQAASRGDGSAGVCPISVCTSHQATTRLFGQPGSTF